MLTQQLEQGQSASQAEAREVEARLQAAAAEERQRLEESWQGRLASLQAQQEELVAGLREEGEGLRGRVSELEDAREVAGSEVASLQADLATLRSEKNTQQMAAEKVLMV